MNFHFHDATLARDPTGTSGIRRSMVTVLQRRWRQLEVATRDVVVARDAFGIKPGAFALVHEPGAKLRAFQDWFDATLRSMVLQDDRGLSLMDFMMRAYSKGHRRGARIAKLELQIDPNGVALMTAAAYAELQGIAEVVSQRAVRHFADGLMARVKPEMIGRIIVEAIRSVGITRSRMLASYAVVRAHAAGTLDALQRAGVQQVGVQAEHVPVTKLRDATLRTRTKRPVRSGQRRANIERAERRLQRLGEVNVETRGDLKVCPICEEIADNGPYDIDAARGLIPAHLNCRCSFSEA